MILNTSFFGGQPLRSGRKISNHWQNRQKFSLFTYPMLCFTFNTIQLAQDTIFKFLSKSLKTLVKFLFFKIFYFLLKTFSKNSLNKLYKLIHFTYRESKQFYFIFWKLIGLLVDTIKHFFHWMMLKKLQQFQKMVFIIYATNSKKFLLTEYRTSTASVYVHVIVLIYSVLWSFRYLEFFLVSFL